MKTNIQYCDEVSNPLQVIDMETGMKGTHCEKPDPDGTCRGCWAEILNMRGKDNTRFGTGLSYSKEHRGRIQWLRHEKEMLRLVRLNGRKPMSGKFPGEKLVVFTNDTYDLFQPSISDGQRDWIFDEYDRLSDLNILIQSTYVSLMNKYLVRRYPDTMPDQYIIGMSAGNQTFFDNNIDHLLEINAVRKYTIFEPLLGPVDIRKYLWPMAKHWDGRYPSYEHAKAAGAFAQLNRQALVHSASRFLSWIICGGESGTNARPAHPDWFRSLRDQCISSETPFLFKQWGEWWPIHAFADDLDEHGAGILDQLDMNTSAQHDWDDYSYSKKIGKKKAGRILDGQIWNEFPSLSSRGKSCDMQANSNKGENKMSEKETAAAEATEETASAEETSAETVTEAAVEAPAENAEAENAE